MSRQAEDDPYYLGRAGAAITVRASLCISELDMSLHKLVQILIFKVNSVCDT